MKKSIIVVAVIAILVIAVFILMSFAKPKPASSPEVSLGYSALRISLPIFVAQDKGYFTEQGLNVKLERFDTAQPMMQSLVAGNLQTAGYTALPITETAMLRGKTDLYFTTSMLEDQNHRISYLIIPKNASQNFSYADLKNKKIGILPTVAYKVWLEQLLQNKGVDVKSVQIVQLDPTLEANALQSKQVDALFTNDPVATTVLQKGIGRLISNEVELLRIFGEPFVFGSFNIRKDFADKNPAITRKLITALDKAVDFINNNPTEAKQILKNYLADAQKPFVDAYPDALYQTSAQVSPQTFQQITNQYHQLGIIDGDLQVENLVITDQFSPK